MSIISGCSCIYRAFLVPEYTRLMKNRCHHIYSEQICTYDFATTTLQQCYTTIVAAIFQTNTLYKQIRHYQHCT
uniref:Uncharacterized protein n=1 Tax=Arundo donax TaxID=35708 RepID=A0A0A9GK15_ARUDO